MRTVKSVALVGEQGFVLALVRGNHSVNEIKLAKLAGLGDYRLATEAEIQAHLGSEPGFLVNAVLAPYMKPLTQLVVDYIQHVLQSIPTVVG